MKTPLLFAAAMLACCIGSGPASAEPPAASVPADARPTDASIRQLLEVMQAKTLVDAIPKQMDAYFTATLNRFAEGKQMSAEQQQAIDRKREDLNALMKENFNWESMQSIYLEVYGKTFSQAEIDSMIAFYSSPAGRAVVVKLPLAMQNTLTIMQQRMQTLMPKIQEMAKDTAAQIKSPPPAPTKPDSG